MSRLGFWEIRGLADVNHTLMNIIALVATVVAVDSMSTLIHAEEAKHQTNYTVQPATQVKIPSQTQTEPNHETQQKAQAKTQTVLTSHLHRETQTQTNSQVQDATNPETRKKTEEQRVTISEQRTMRYPYRWISNYLYRQHLDELANERRERLRTRSEALREGLNRYSSASHWWYTPWSEARRQWLDAPQDYLRELADLRREQIFAERDHRREMIHPLLRPNPAAWGPYGTGPWKPNLGPWGPYP